jgi:hypothetical protein
MTQTSSVIVDMVWLTATAEDRLEHVRAHSGPDRITLVFFLKACDMGSAQTASRRLSDRLISTVPFLTGWRVQGCWPLDSPDRDADQPRVSSTEPE